MNTEMLANLREHLTVNPQIETIFFNKKGEWTFHRANAKHGYLNGKTRGEVLADDFVLGEETAVPVVKIAPPTAKELIEGINAAETEEAVLAILGTDIRKTVKDAADARIKAINEKLI